MPKRGLTGFLFCKEEKVKVIRDRPDLIAMRVILREMGRRWSMAAPEVKAKFEALAKIDQDRYRREKEEYMKRSSGSCAWVWQLYLVLESL